MLRKQPWLMLLLVVVLAGCTLVPSRKASEAPTPIPCPTCEPVNCPTAEPTAEPPLEFPTPEPTEEPTAEPTLEPTATEVPATATAVPTLAPTVTATAVPMPYSIQANTPVYLQNFAHPAAACKWMGVAGQAFDKGGKTVNNLVVEVSGTVDGKPFSQITLTGLAAAYGPGGYEIPLDGKALDSTGALQVALYDLAGKPLIAPFTFDTFADCQKNLILINFAERAN